jgi:precorrin-4/cobalt-precorrin-4 C11-methyltransferase
MNQISIVGAGPGALDLMTIRAQQRLKSADVLVWTDSLIPTQITKLVKDDCEKIKDKFINTRRNTFDLN